MIEETSLRAAAGAAVEQAQWVSDLGILVRRGMKYGTICLDPPWKYDVGHWQMCAANHYRTMDFDDIAALPIAKLAAEDCHLHLWTTDAFDEAAQSLLRNWGFTYKSRLVWDKMSIGTGVWWRLQHEFLLLGVKGRAPFPRHDYPSVVRAQRREHSVKPSIFRSLIEEVSPAPRLELFARQVCDGWTVWGNEVPASLFASEISET